MLLSHRSHIITAFLNKLEGNVSCVDKNRITYDLRLRSTFVDW